MFAQEGGHAGHQAAAGLLLAEAGHEFDQPPLHFPQAGVVVAKAVLELADEQLAQAAVAAYQGDQLVEVDQREAIEQAHDLLLGAVVLADLVVELADEAEIAVEPLPQAVDGVGKAAVEVVYLLAQAQ